MKFIRSLKQRLGSTATHAAADPVRNPVSDPVRNPACSEFEVDNWELSRFVLDKLVPAVGTHPFPLHELMLLSAAVCRVRPAQIYEWGTHIGKSALAFHHCVTHFGIPCEIHSVDLPDKVQHVEHPEGERGRLVRGIAGVHLHQGDGVETSLELWRKLGRSDKVLFFVDGDHEYASVHRELSAILREIPAAGVLLHDTFYQSSGSGYNIGPHQAIADVLAGHAGAYRRVDSGLGLPGMTLLYRR